MLLKEYENKPVNGKYYLLSIDGNINHIVKCNPKKNWQSSDMTNISCTVYNSYTDRVSDKACYLTKNNRLYMKTKRDGRLFLDEFKDSKPVNPYKIITLCGSTKFKAEFLEVQKRLTLKGYIVISVGLFGHSGDEEVWSNNTKQMLDNMHKRKIDMADEIFVVDVDGYIGESTLSEIVYAENYGKKVYYFSKNQQRLYQDRELI